MDLSGLLKVIIADIKAKDHDSVLKELSARLIEDTGPEGAKALCDLKEHESAEGVLSGTGSAIFHCLSESVPDTVAAIAVSKKGVPSKSRRAPARIFFLIISPIKESGAHFQLLSKLEGLLLDKAFQHAILNAASPEGIKSEIKKRENAARSFYIPLPREEVFEELNTTENGLSSDEALKRLRLTGPNSIKRIAKGTLLRDFLDNMFLNLFAVLLWAGGFMSFIAGMPELAVAIFLVIIINAIFSFLQEYKAEKAVEALSRLLPKKVLAVRDGETKEVDASTLVPGDLILLSEGDSIPADGRLIEAEEMRVDNSALTGESKPVYKISEHLPERKGFIWTEVPNMAFAGTSVVSGAGKMIVTATGMDTEIGRVAYLTQAIKPETSPLQKELENVTKVITAIAASLGIVFFIIGYMLAGLSFAESFIFAIGIIVANVPEGLFPTVSLSLAMGVQRMASKQAIVKKLSAVETLGSATVICTDKTGTLTANQMSVRAIFINGKAIEVTGQGYEPKGEFIIGGKALSASDIERHGIPKMLTAAALCNNAMLHPPGKVSAGWTVSGDPTEGALLTLAGKAGLKPDDLNASLPRIFHIPFERVRKRMSTIHEGKGGFEAKEGHRLAFVKGAPKEVLELCVSSLHDNRIKALDEHEKRAILSENDRMASLGLRILAVAYRDIEKKEAYSAKETEAGLVFLGLAAMLDPPRPEVKEAIAECKTAGIKVIMVTGDYGLTAKAIAEQVGITSGGRVITGEELNAMPHRQLREALKKEEVIFARVEPQDKLRVVTALQDNGEIVAVTGDGVNDAPALKKADIGVAMGLRGSDVAKESAEIVLTDDNFASIVEAVKEGRAVYSNIKKFVTYIFASNIPEVVPFIIFVIFKVPLPLTVMQILAIDLGTDVFPALGLGIESPEKDIMKRPPRPKGKRLLDFATLGRAYLFLGPLEAILGLSGFFFAYWIRGWVPGEPMPSTGVVYAAATTMSFAGIVASQIGNVFACRTERESVFTAGFFRNRFILSSILIETVIALTLIYTPFLQRVFGFAPLTTTEWAFLSLFPAIMIIFAEFRKSVIRRRA